MLLLILIVHVLGSHALHLVDRLVLLLGLDPGLVLLLILFVLLLVFLLLDLEVCRLGPERLVGRAATLIKVVQDARTLGEYVAGGSIALALAALAEVVGVLRLVLLLLDRVQVVEPHQHLDLRRRAQRATWPQWPRSEVEARGPTGDQRGRKAAQASLADQVLVLGLLAQLLFVLTDVALLLCKLLELFLVLQAQFLLELGLLALGNFLESLDDAAHLHEVGELGVEAEELVQVVDLLDGLAHAGDLEP